MSTLSCPHCNQRVAFNPALSGKAVACPSCNGRFLMPDGPAPAPAPTSPAPTSQDAHPNITADESPFSPSEPVHPSAFKATTSSSAGLGAAGRKKTKNTAHEIVKVVLGGIGGLAITALALFVFLPNQNWFGAKSEKKKEASSSVAKAPKSAFLSDSKTAKADTNSQPPLSPSTQPKGSSGAGLGADQGNRVSKAVGKNAPKTPKNNAAIRPQPSKNPSAPAGTVDSSSKNPFESAENPFENVDQSRPSEEKLPYKLIKPMAIRLAGEENVHPISLTVPSGQELVFEVLSINGFHHPRYKTLPQNARVEPGRSVRIQFDDPLDTQLRLVLETDGNQPVVKTQFTFEISPGSEGTALTKERVAAGATNNWRVLEEKLIQYYQWASLLKIPSSQASKLLPSWMNLSRYNKKTQGAISQSEQIKARKAMLNLANRTIPGAKKRLARLCAAACYGAAIDGKATVSFRVLTKPASPQTGQPGGQQTGQPDAYEKPLLYAQDRTPAKELREQLPAQTAKSLTADILTAAGDWMAADTQNADANRKVFLYVLGENFVMDRQLMMMRVSLDRMKQAYPDLKLTDNQLDSIARAIKDIVTKKGWDRLSQGELQTNVETKLAARYPSSPGPIKDFMVEMIRDAASNAPSSASSFSPRSSSSRISSFSSGFPPTFSAVRAPVRQPGK